MLVPPWWVGTEEPRRQPSRVRRLALAVRPKLQLEVQPVGARPMEQSRLPEKVRTVRTAVYWTATDANANTTTDFQEHCMVCAWTHQVAMAMAEAQQVHR